MATVQYEKVSADELFARLDELTRSQLGLSGDEFLVRCRDRDLNMASPGVSRLALLARLVDAARAEKA